MSRSSFSHGWPQRRPFLFLLPALCLLLFLGSCAGGESRAVQQAATAFLKQNAPLDTQGPYELSNVDVHGDEATVDVTASGPDGSVVFRLFARKAGDQWKIEDKAQLLQKTLRLVPAPSSKSDGP